MEEEPVRSPGLCEILGREAVEKLQLFYSKWVGAHDLEGRVGRKGGVHLSREDEVPVRVCGDIDLVREAGESNGLPDVFDQGIDAVIGQVIETVNESRATREGQKTKGYGLFDTYEGREGDTFEAGWRNKLIWGDNLLVMGSLLEKFAGKIDLIYIDPPFATGANFSFRTPVGDTGIEIHKDPSLMEEKAYRDTWGGGSASYLQMMRDRLALMRSLLSPKGTLYLHCDWRMAHFLRGILGEVFTEQSFQNEIVWQKTRVVKAQSSSFGSVHDVILMYSKSGGNIFNQQMMKQDAEYEKKFDKVEPSTGRRYQLVSLLQAGKGPARRFGKKTLDPGPGRHWIWSQERIDEAMKDGLIEFTSGGMPRKKQYLDQSEGRIVDDMWLDIFPVNSQAKEDTGYDTQKPESLLERIIQTSSTGSSLVADFFCGSGTTLAVAEKLGRRWIGCDLGRWGIHVTRKRLLGIEGCKPFEVLNLGKYERQYWQGVTFGDRRDRSLSEQTLYKYLAFILKLHKAQPVVGMRHLHGKKGKAMVHIGAVDAPVTIAEIDAAVDECEKVRQTELHVLGWEWEMGLYDLMVDAAKKKGVKLLLLQIPREVMERQEAAQDDARFFELAYLEAEIKQPKKLTAQVALRGFVIPNTELIPEEVRSKVKYWSDFIDYWAVDWDFQNDTFMQGWVAYRTRKERKLPLVSDPHTYEKPGRYSVLVKVIDIFGNDTSQAFAVEVK